MTYRVTLYLETCGHMLYKV